MTVGGLTRLTASITKRLAASLQLSPTKYFLMLFNAAAVLLLFLFQVAEALNAVRSTGGPHPDTCFKFVAYWGQNSCRKHFQIYLYLTLIFDSEL